MSNYFIILASGQSKRFNSKKPKQYSIYKNKPLYKHSLDKALKSNQIYTGNKSICSKRVAEPKPAVANSPNTEIYQSIIKFPIDIINNAAEIGAD